MARERAVFGEGRNREVKLLKMAARFVLERRSFGSLQTFDTWGWRSPIPQRKMGTR